MSQSDSRLWSDQSRSRIFSKIEPRIVAELPTLTAPIATSQLASNTPATRFTSDLLIYAIVSLSENPQQMQSKPDPSTPRPPSGASGAVVPGSKLDQAIQNAGAELEDAFRAELDDNRIRNRLDFAWIKVRNAIDKAGDSKLMKRLKDESEFFSYVSPGSDNERELINLLRSMAAQEVPWRDLFKSGTSLSSF
jgi:hypothetical protein